MKKGILINSEISYAIAKMGHGDRLTICDSGLPIPKGVQRIDLALREGIPTFIDTLDAILEELKVEEVVIAKQMKQVSPELYEKVIDRLSNIQKSESVSIEVTEVDHETFKEMTEVSVCVVRTGEYTPYANILLKSGVVF